MATLFESIGIFADIFDFFLPFLLVFSVLFALLQKTEYLSKSMNINAVISFTVALLVSLSGVAQFITKITPLLSALFIIFFLMFLIFLFFGADPKSLFKTKGPSIIIIVVCIIFVLYAFADVFGSQLADIGTEGGTAEVILDEDSGEIIVTSDAIVPGQETCDFYHLTGKKAFICMLGNPRFLGTIMLLGLLTIATFFIVNESTSS